MAGWTTIVGNQAEQHGDTNLTQHNNPFGRWGRGWGSWWLRWKQRYSSLYTWVSEWPWPLSSCCSLPVCLFYTMKTVEGKEEKNVWPSVTCSCICLIVSSCLFCRLYLVFIVMAESAISELVCSCQHLSHPRGPKVILSYPPGHKLIGSLSKSPAPSSLIAETGVWFLSEVTSLWLIWLPDACGHF